MNIFLVLSFLFTIGSMIGWCLELVYRRYSKDNIDRRWINPGFLIGPYLPLYGFGLCALYLLACYGSLHIIQNEIMRKVVLFVIMAVAMTLIEYAAGIIFIKKMKVKLWDYTDEWCNYQGIICPKYSLYWAILGAVYYFLIHPHILSALTWLSRNLAFSFVIGFFFGIFVVDLGFSIKILNKIRTFAVENNIIMKYELLKIQISKSTQGGKEKLKFLLPFHTLQPLSTHLKRYLEIAIAFEESQIKGKLSETTRVIRDTKQKINRKINSEK